MTLLVTVVTDNFWGRFPSIGSSPINGQSKALGIERPKVSNGQSVARLNTLIYLISNGRALVKAKSINAQLLSIK
jgi:hypothetical protein